jgi:ribA/ribD-fused uncharacterized protein
MDGVEYNCSEQAMMSKKALFFGDIEANEKIMASKSPREQKAIGRTVKNFDVDKWSSVSRDIVYDIVKAKFEQNPQLLKELLATEGKTLTEASPFDKIWGIGLSEDNPLAWEKETWQGTNLLGYILTDVRDDINKQDAPFTTYEEYKQYVIAEWNDGYLNELNEAGLITQSEVYTNSEGVKSQDCSLLTEEIYNEKFNNGIRGK